MQLISNNIWASGIRWDLFPSPPFADDAAQKLCSGDVSIHTCEGVLKYFWTRTSCFDPPSMYVRPKMPAAQLIITSEVQPPLAAAGLMWLIWVMKWKLIVFGFCVLGVVFVVAIPSFACHLRFQRRSNSSDFHIDSCQIIAPRFPQKLIHARDT